MKVSLIIAIITFQFSCCFSQQLMETIKDGQHIKDSQSRFINKPMRDLLKEIKPPIKWVTANPSDNINFNVGYFYFNFLDSKQKDSMRSEKKLPLTIVVYVKEDFDWDFKSRRKGKETVWTSEDSIKYGNLTIVGFRVFGDGITSN